MVVIKMHDMALTDGRILIVAAQSAHDFPLRDLADKVIEVDGRRLRVTEIQPPHAEGEVHPRVGLLVVPA